MAKLNDVLKGHEAWRPLIIALLVIVVIAISHKIYWETTAETNPGKIWDGQTFAIDGTDENPIWRLKFEQEVDDEIVFKGVLETSPQNEVYQNFTKDAFIEAEGLVYTEDLYGKTMLNVGGMRILVNGDLSGEFFESEIIIIKAHLVENTTTFPSGLSDVTLIREGWEAEPEDIQLASDTDKYFFGTEVLILLFGTYLYLKNMKHLRNQLNLIWHLAKFEFNSGMRTSRMIVLGLFFSLFIIGMGWALGDLQDAERNSAFYVESGKTALIQFSFFTFFVVSGCNRSFSRLISQRKTNQYYEYAPCKTYKS